MKIFQLNFDFAYALADVVNADGKVDILDITSENTNLLSKLQFDWTMTESSIIPDIAIIVSELLCCNTNGLPIIERVLPTVKPFEIYVGKNQFYSLFNISNQKGKLNLKSSKIKYFSTGDIMEIEKPVFNQGEYPSIFKVEEMPGVFFCTEIFKDTIEKNHLTGLIFTECKIKSKSWFSK